MTSIRTTAHIGSDGTLFVQVPTDLREIDVDVLLDVQPASESTTRKTDSPKTPEELGWSSGFFEETYGSLSDDPLERLPQGEFEVREPIV